MSNKVEVRLMLESYSYMLCEFDPAFEHTHILTREEVNSALHDDGLAIKFVPTGESAPLPERTFSVDNMRGCWYYAKNYGVGTSFEKYMKDEFGVTTHTYEFFDVHSNTWVAGVPTMVIMQGLDDMKWRPKDARIFTYRGTLWRVAS